MNPTTAALLAALEDAIRFVESAGGPKTALAERTTAPWRAAIAAVAAPEESADPIQAIKFHLDRAVDLNYEGWLHALDVSELAGVDVGDVLNSIQALGTINDGQPSNLPSDRVATLIASWHETARRRRTAKRL